jgi:hypothetical protein
MKRFRIHSFLLISLVGLSFMSFILSINTHKTVEVAVWLNEKGIVLMGVGVLYLVFGFILTRVRH